MATITDRLRLILDAQVTKFQQGLKDAQASLANFGKSIKVGREAANKEFAGLEKRIDGAAKKIGNSIFSIRNALATLAAGAGLAAPARFAASFEKALANVDTLLEGAAVGIDQYRKQLLELSRASSKDLIDLTNGLYRAISAGIPAVEGAAGAFAVLEEAQKAAVAGLSDTETAVTAFTTVLNSYKDAGLTAADVGDRLFTTVRIADTDFNQLASSIGRVTTVGARFGISIEELLAAIAELTKGGLSTDEAVTQLRATILGLSRPSAAVRKELDSLGVEFGAAAFASKGLIGVLEDVRQATAGNADDFARLFPNVRALVGALVLGSGGTDDFRKSLEALNNSAGASNTAFQKQAATFEELAGRFKSQIIEVFTDAGQRVLPQLRTVVEDLSAALSSNGDEIAQTFADVASALISIGRFVAENGGDLVQFAVTFFAVSRIAAATTALLGFAKALTAVGAAATATAGAAAGASFLTGFQKAIRGLPGLISKLIRSPGPLGLIVAAGVFIGEALIDGIDAVFGDGIEELAAEAAERARELAERQDTSARDRGFIDRNDEASFRERVEAGELLVTGDNFDLESLNRSELVDAGRFLTQRTRELGGDLEAAGDELLKLAARQAQALRAVEQNFNNTAQDLADRALLTDRAARRFGPRTQTRAALDADAAALRETASSLSSRADRFGAGADETLERARQAEFRAFAARDESEAEEEEAQRQQEEAAARRRRQAAARRAAQAAERDRQRAIRQSERFADFDVDQRDIASDSEAIQRGNLQNRSALIERDISEEIRQLERRGELLALQDQEATATQEALRQLENDRDAQNISALDRRLALLDEQRTLAREIFEEQSAAITANSDAEKQAVIDNANNLLSRVGEDAAARENIEQGLSARLAELDRQRLVELTQLRQDALGEAGDLTGELDALREEREALQAALSLRQAEQASASSFGGQVVEGLLIAVDAAESAFIELGSLIGNSAIDALRSAINSVIQPVQAALVRPVRDITGSLGRALRDVGTGDLTGEQASAAIEDQAREATRSIFRIVDAIPQVVETFVQTLANALPAIIIKISEGLAGAITALANNIGPLINNVLLGFLEAVPILIDAIVAAIPQVLDAILKGIILIFERLPALISNLLGNLGPLLENIFTTIANNIGPLVTSVIQGLLGAINEILVQLPVIVNTIVEGLGDVLNELVASLPDIIGGIFEVLPSLIINLIALLPSLVVSLIDGLVDALTQLLSDGIPRLVERLPEIIPELIDGLIIALGQFLSEGLPQLIAALVASLPDLVAALALLIPRLLIGITRGIGRLLGRFLQGIIDFFRGGFLRALLDGLAQILGSGLEAITGGGGTTGRIIRGVATGGLSELPNIFHSGGIIGSGGRNPVGSRLLALAGAPMFQNGGMVGSIDSALSRAMSTPFKDEQIILAQKGEGVLSLDGVRAAGGPAGVESLNRGNAPSGGGVRVSIVGNSSGIEALLSQLISQVAVEIDTPGSQISNAVAAAGGGAFNADPIRGVR